MKISIIIPTYNNLKLCKQALDSVLKQEDCEYEVVIVDDSSTNDIMQYISAFGNSKIRYFHNKPAKGPVNNWNYGLSLIDGDAVIVLHHDELFANKDYLSRLSKHLVNHDLIITNKKVFLGDKEKKDIIPNWVKCFFLKFRYPLLALNVIGPCACFCFKKSCSTEFDNSLHWKVDTEWYFRLLEKSNNYLFCKEREIISYHGHNEQITNNIDIAAVTSKDRDLIMKKYHNFWVTLWIKIGGFIK